MTMVPLALTRATACFSVLHGLAGVPHVALSVPVFATLTTSSVAAAAETVVTVRAAKTVPIWRCMTPSVDDAIRAPVRNQAEGMSLREEGSAGDQTGLPGHFIRLRRRRVFAHVPSRDRKIIQENACRWRAADVAGVRRVPRAQLQ